MISSFLSSDYHTEVFNRRRKRRIVVYGSVTRYGPRNQLPAQGVNIETKEIVIVSTGKSSPIIALTLSIRSDITLSYIVSCNAKCIRLLRSSANYRKRRSELLARFKDDVPLKVQRVKEES